MIVRESLLISTNILWICGLINMPKKKRTQKRKTLKIWHLDPFTQSNEKMKSLITYSNEVDTADDEIYYVYDDPVPLSFMLWR